MTERRHRCDDDAPRPVELLRDGRGVYGIGVSDDERWDFEQRPSR